MSLALNSIKTWPPTLMWAVFFALPVALLFFTINHYKVDIIYSDELDYVPAVARLHQGAFTVNDLRIQHLSHRPVVPLLLVGLLSLVTNWHPAYELLLAPLFALGSVYILLVIADTTLSHQSWTTRRLLEICIVILALSLHQHTVWVKSPFFAIHLLNFCFLLGLWLLLYRKRTWLVFSGAAACAVIATLTLNQGMLLWLFLFAALYVSTDKHPHWPKKYMYTWAMGAFFVISLYYTNFQADPLHTAAPPDFFTIFQYALIFIGGWFTTLFAPSALIIGIIVFGTLLLLAWITHQGNSWKKYLPYGFIALYVLTLAFATAITRGELGIEHALRPRYVAMSYLGITVVLVWVFSLVKHLSIREGYIYLLLIALIGQQVHAGYVSLRDWRVHQQNLLTAKKCIETHETPSADCLAPLGNALLSNDIVHERIRTFYSVRNLNTFPFK